MYLRTYYLIFLFSIFNRIICDLDKNQIDTYQNLYESWIKLNKFQTVNLDLLTSGLASKLDNLIEYTPNITSKCIRSLIEFRKDAQEMKYWAIRALDSWSRFPASGFLHGTFSSLGDYEMCLENDKLQYCTVHLKPVLPQRRSFRSVNSKIEILIDFINDKQIAISDFADNAQLFYYTSMRIGLCLPNDCSTCEVNHLLQSGENFYHSNRFL